MIRIGIPKSPGPGGLRPGAWRAIAALCAAYLAVSCIERSNPFDPLNAGDAKGAEIRNQLQSRLDSLASGEAVYAGALAGYDSVFRKDSSDNAGKMADNDARRDTNSALAKRNSAVATANANAPLDSLGQQQFYWFLDTLKAYGKYPGLDTVPRAISAQAAKLMAFMFQANADHAPAVVYPASVIDSVLRPFARDSAAFAVLQSRIDAGNRAVAGYNAAAQADNAAWAAANAKVADYNVSIAWLKETRNKPVIARADSMSSGTKSAKAGDTLFVAPGKMSVELRFSNSGTADKPILVRGYPGGATILQAPAGSSQELILSSNSNIQFQDIVFVGGVKLENSSLNVTFHRCVFTGSGTLGLEVVDSRADLSDCRIVQNFIGARFSFQGDTNQARFSLDNVLIARNTSHGLILNNPSGSLRNCTISDNGGDGINLIVQRNEIAITNSIISGNHGIGIYRQRTTEWPQQPVVQYCDLWENGEGDWSLGGLDSAAVAAMKNLDFGAPPGFNDPTALDYGLQPGSAVFGLERRSPPLKVGYRP